MSLPRDRSTKSAILVGQMKKRVRRSSGKTLAGVGGAIKNEQMADELLADVTGVMLMHKPGSTQMHRLSFSGT